MTAAVLDFDALLAPIPGDAACGADLRADRSTASPLHALRAARNAARRLEEDHWREEAAADGPDWTPILNDGVALLSSKSKDMEVAAWVLEAAVREYGFAGLRDGIRLMREFAQRFWEGLYPAEDPEGDDEHPRRAEPLAWLNGDSKEGTLIRPIRSIPLVEPGGDAPIGLALYEQAAAIAKLDDENERLRRIKDGAVSLETVNKAFAASSGEFYRAALEDVSAASSEFEQLVQTLDQHCGAKSPPTSRIRETIEQCRLVVQGWAEKKLGRGAAAGGVATIAGGAGAARGDAAAHSGPVRSREQAFDMVHDVARFFRETEPQSIVSWHLEEVVRLGRMSLPDLLTELINDDGVRGSIFKRVGIRPPKEDE